MQWRVSYYDIVITTLPGSSSNAIRGSLHPSKLRAMAARDVLLQAARLSRTEPTIRSESIAHGSRKFLLQLLALPGNRFRVIFKANHESPTPEIARISRYKADGSGDRGLAKAATYRLL